MESEKGEGAKKEKTNKVFEDYGSAYGSYGEDNDDKYYEDIVGKDFDDDWHFEREPKEGE